MTRKVHIDRNGINVVDESGNQKVYTDENGHIYGDKDYKKNGKKSPAMEFPIWLVSVVAFPFIWFFKYFRWLGNQLVVVLGYSTVLHNSKGYTEKESNYFLLSGVYYLGIFSVRFLC